MNINIKKQTKEYKDRHKLGQFFTSDELVEKITNIFSINYDDKDILEPSFGGCSFVKYIIENSSNSTITAVDIDRKLCKKYSNIYQDVFFVCSDFLAYDFEKRFDVIIGNPPFNLKTKFDYYDSTEGFILKSLSLLKENGYLYFVAPSTILRNKQYENLRRIIIENYQIKGIINTSKYEFLGADIETVVICIRNKKVKKQKYKYYNGDDVRKIELDINDKYTITINNKDIFDSIICRLDDNSLGELFEIRRGHSNNPSDLRGRDINFYNHFLKQKKGKDYFVALQNIAYRFTGNLIQGNTDNVCDTITMLLPNKKMSTNYLCFVSEFLNSSVANYLLHINALNECRLTIHIDKYYISDIRIPKYNKSFEKYILNANKIGNTQELGKERNIFFYKLLKLSKEEIDEIERIWSFPIFKEKDKFCL